jgi:hypothetical protein
MQSIGEVGDGYTAIGVFTAPDGSTFYRTKALTVEEFARAVRGLGVANIDFRVTAEEGTMFPGVTVCDGVSKPPRLLQCPKGDV